MLIGWFITSFAVAAAFTILTQDARNEKKRIEKLNQSFNGLFHNMGILQPNGWVKCLRTFHDPPVYYRFEFEIADNISVIDFIEKIDRIAEKMGYLEINQVGERINLLNIYFEDNLMYFEIDRRSTFFR